MEKLWVLDAHLLFRFLPIHHINNFIIHFCHLTLKKAKNAEEYRGLLSIYNHLYEIALLISGVHRLVG